MVKGEIRNLNYNARIHNIEVNENITSYNSTQYNIINISIDT